ncbi:hypothetical protein ALP29_201313 [Pseudomonas syringae pv. avii]|uniref:Uncharacterized protein n=1 Tax=Pseudomonas syringae pv. avii TaxID=663959 RepID=A0A3M5W396_PSESX|nr:hypothetical protein ALP29_201313 [Pseudomonas syringae pv. avii]
MLHPENFFQVVKINYEHDLFHFVMILPKE